MSLNPIWVLCSGCFILPINKEVDLLVTSGINAFLIPSDQCNPPIKYLQYTYEFAYPLKICIFHWPSNQINIFSVMFNKKYAKPNVFQSSQHYICIYTFLADKLCLPQSSNTLYLSYFLKFQEWLLFKLQRYVQTTFANPSVVAQYFNSSSLEAEAGRCL